MTPRKKRPTGDREQDQRRIEADRAEDNRRQTEAEAEAVEAKRPNRTGKALNVWLPDPVHLALERFRAAQRIRPSMTETVEVAIQEFLRREGYWPVPAEPV